MKNRFGNRLASLSPPNPALRHVSLDASAYALRNPSTRPSQAVELIQRLDFDEATKNSFISLMQKELFASHAEFLKIPLLCVVMLLTYSDAGRISRKKHEFYEDAFNALWSKHDARKQAGFEREKYTGLDKNEFMRLLSAFCASSYLPSYFGW